MMDTNRLKINSHGIKEPIGKYDFPKEDNYVEKVLVNDKLSLKNMIADLKQL